jgi:hypothetical protein
VKDNNDTAISVMEARLCGGNSVVVIGMNAEIERCGATKRTKKRGNYLRYRSQGERVVP